MKKEKEQKKCDSFNYDIIIKNKEDKKRDMYANFFFLYLITHVVMPCEKCLIFYVSRKMSRLMSIGSVVGTTEVSFLSQGVFLFNEFYYELIKFE